jgi:ElaB/YqjD/DUF883 family membrane-anchored ribosome-binding protein
MQETGLHGSTTGAAGSTRYEDTVAEKAGATLSNLKGTAQDTVERAAQAAQRLSAQAGELWAQRDQTIESARTYIRAHPIATIGIAIAVGLLLSRLTTRR